MEELYACAQEGRCSNVHAIVAQLQEGIAWRQHALALRLAAVNDHIDVVRVMLASLGLVAFLSAITYVPHNARSAVEAAARHGRTSILQLFTQSLLLTGDDIRTKVNDALSWAVLGGVCDDFPGVVRVLVSAKADPTRFLADVAEGCGDADMLRALLAHKASVRDFRAHAALHCAIEFNPHPTDVLSQLLEANADPDVQNPPWAWSPLYMAASKMMASKDDKHNCIDLLLDAKAAVNGINDQRPIIAAINGSDAVTVRMLLQAKSAVDWPCAGEYQSQSALSALLQSTPRTTTAVTTALSIARTLIAAKAVVDHQHVSRAAVHHSSEMISTVFRADPDRALAAKVVLTYMHPRRIMKAFVEGEMRGDVSSVDTALTGELVEEHGRRKGSATVLRVLIAAKATVRRDAIVSAVSADDPRVLDALRLAGARVDRQVLQLALAEADTYSYDLARAKIRAMLAALNDDDQDRPPKLKRM